jgi:hypothetical protein
MNIFKILASGDGSIKEPSISAFLGYLLNPNEDHGMGAIFLNQLMNQHFSQNESNSYFKGLSEKNEIINFSAGSGFSVDVFLEQGFKEAKGKKQIVDLIIFIYHFETQGKEDLSINMITKRKKLVHIILVEVKINDRAGKDEQLYNQINNSKAVLTSLIEQEKKHLIIHIPTNVIDNMSMIYLTPKGTTTDRLFAEIKNSAFKKHPMSHMHWSKSDQIAALEYENEQTLKFNRQNDSDEKDLDEEDLDEEDSIKVDLEKNYNRFSIETILDKIINNVFDIRNEIIPEYTKQTLQAFSNFIYTDFKPLKKQKPGGDRTEWIYDKEAIFNRLEAATTQENITSAKDVDDLINKSFNGKLHHRMRKNAKQIRISYAYERGKRDVALILIFVPNGIKLVLPKDHFPPNFDIREWKEVGTRNQWREKLTIKRDELKELRKIILHSIESSLKNRGKVF